MNPIRIFVGTDDSQNLAVKVLEHSIRRNTFHPIEVVGMNQLDIPIPKDLRNQARTGFSFYRFVIPELCGYQGKAIYMDADMQVFKDISELWNLPMEGKKLLLQEEISEDQARIRKIGSPLQRWRQSSVMLLDCGALNWNIREIVRDLDEGKYSYDQLMKELCILDDSEIGASIPFRWNSLEHYDAMTANIHYTDMNTQPWVSSLNKNGYLWFMEVRQMLESGSLSLSEIQNGIQVGYFRPSLIDDIERPKKRQPIHFWLKGLQHLFLDRLKGYVPHKVVNEQFQKRKREHGIT